MYINHLYSYVASIFYTLFAIFTLLTLFMKGSLHLPVEMLHKEMDYHCISGLQGKVCEVQCRFLGTVERPTRRPLQQSPLRDTLLLVWGSRTGDGSTRMTSLRRMASTTQ